MKGHVNTEGTREIETNGRGINDTLNSEGPGGELLGLGLERNVPSKEPNLLTRLIIWGRSPLLVSHVLVVIRGVEESHSSVLPDPLASA